MADKFRKAVDMGYGLVDLFEFWEYVVTGYGKDINSGSLFAEYVDMFLKLKKYRLAKHPGFKVRRTRTDNRGLPAREENCFGQGIHFQKCGANTFGKSEIKLNVGKVGAKPKQDTHNSCYLREKVVHASKKSGY